MNQLYPKHSKALKLAKLAPKCYPKLGELLDSIINKKSMEEKIKEKRSRQCHFCIGVSKAWKKPIHTILKKLRDKYELKWLRISMSYHKFSNLREIFQGNMGSKLMAGVELLDFIDRPCNSNHDTKINGECVYGDKCRKRVIVYKATCNQCGMIYIGNTQQQFKDRMN